MIRSSIKTLLSAAFFVLAFLFLYFRKFPIIGTAVSSDILLLISTTLLFSVILIAAYLSSSRAEYSLTILAISFNIFLFRSIRNLRLEWPALWDPYMHLATLTNILSGNGLEVTITAWTTILHKMMYWPMMYLLSVGIIEGTGLPKALVFKYQSPFLGIILFLTIAIIGRNVSNSLTIGVTGALISASASNIVFYQSEYHQQGYVLVIFLLLLFVFLRTITHPSWRWHLIGIVIVGPTFVLAHYFSPLLIAPLFAAVVIGTIVRAYLGGFPGIPDILDMSDTWVLPVIIVGIGVVYVHFLTPTIHLERYLTLMFASSPNNTSLTGVGTTRPFTMTVIRSTKWIVLMLGLPALAYSVWKGTKQQVILSGFIGVFLLVGLLGQYGVFLSVGRIVTFYALLIGIMAATTLFWLVESDLIPGSRLQRLVPICLLVGCILTVTAFGGHFVPAYYLQSAEENDWYYNSNNLPEVEKYPSAGKWLRNYGSSTYAVGGDGTTKGFTAVIPAYWGRSSVQPGVFPWYSGVPPQRVGGVSLPIQDDGKVSRYFFLNRRYGYNYTEISHNKAYTNGEIVVISD